MLRQYAIICPASSIGHGWRPSARWIANTLSSVLCLGLAMEVVPLARRIVITLSSVLCLGLAIEGVPLQDGLPIRYHLCCVWDWPWRESPCKMDCQYAIICAVSGIGHGGCTPCKMDCQYAIICAVSGIGHGGCSPTRWIANTLSSVLCLGLAMEGVPLQDGLPIRYHLCCVWDWPWRVFPYKMDCQYAIICAVSGIGHRGSTPCKMDCQYAIICPVSRIGYRRSRPARRIAITPSSVSSCVQLAMEAVPPASWFSITRSSDLCLSVSDLTRMVASFCSWPIGLVRLQLTL